MGTITLAAAQLAVLGSPALATADCQVADQDEVLVCGRRTSDRYRLDPASRLATAGPRESARAHVTGRFECRNVGPLGCGTELLPIVRVSSGGEVKVGQ